MNRIFALLVFGAFGTAALRELFGPGGDGSPMEALSRAMLDSAAAAVQLALGLIGAMTLFLGLVKVAENGGLLCLIARVLQPLMQRLFPEIPPGHPAMGAMVLNLSANVLGLGNAATPFGIRAMQELNRLNPTPGTATDAMALFLAINTSSVTLLPTGVIALRAAVGSADPAAILPTTLLATSCSTAAAIVAAKLFARAGRKGAPAAAAEPCLQPETSDGDSEEPALPPAFPLWVSLAALSGIASAIALLLLGGRSASPWLLPSLMAGFLLYGWIRGVKVYESFVEGARGGFEVAVRILPYLVAILVAVDMLRASGALEALVGLVGRWTGTIGLPAEALPVALTRPLSGSGAFAILASILKDPAIGPDSYIGLLVSTLQGSTETTFYVLAVYFGAVQVHRLRYAVAPALIADLTGILASVAACRIFFGGA
ncbi:MAG: nucleoside recognition domain-containing protein [Desulfobacterales bacterium]